MNANEAGGKNIVVAFSIPIDDVDAMHHAFICIGDQVPFPFAGFVVDQRRVAAIIRRFRGRAGQRRIHEQTIRDAQAMGGSKPVDLLHRPELPGIAIVRQERNDSNAVLRLIGEFMGDHQFRNAIAIGIERGHIDHALQIADDHMPLPRRILKPDQLRHAGSKRDDIGTPVFIEVGEHYLIAALQIRGDGVFAKLLRLRQRDAA